MRTSLLIPVALLAGCTIQEDEFREAFGRTACSRIHECELAQYEDRYDKRSDCVTEWAEFADTILDVGDTLGREYSPAGAQDCLQAMRDASCSDFTSANYTCDVFE